MQKIRYLNLLDSTSRVKTTNCFLYNNTIIFAVPRHMVSQAIGPDAINIRKLQERLGKKVRIIPDSESPADIERFVSTVVAPTKFKSIEVKENTLFITAGSTQSKAALIGRNKHRLEELDRIVQDVFGFGVRIL